MVGDGPEITTYLAAVICGRVRSESAALERADDRTSVTSQPVRAPVTGQAPFNGPHMAGPVINFPRRTASVTGSSRGSRPAQSQPRPSPSTSQTPRSESTSQTPRSESASLAPNSQTPRSEAASLVAEPTLKRKTDIVQFPGTFVRNGS